MQRLSQLRGSTLSCSETRERSTRRALATNLPPLTPTEPVTEILNGVALTDSYRWLEDQNSPRTRTWLEEQSAYARAYLDAAPGRKRIRQRIEELLSVEVVSDPWKVGNRYFYLKRRAHQEQPAITMREGNHGKEIVLVDPAARGEGSQAAVKIIDILRDGKILAYSVKHDGTHSESVEFLDIPRRQIMPDRLPNSSGQALVFSPDTPGFYYCQEVNDCSRPHYRAVYLHEFGCPSEEDVEIFFAGEDANLHVGLFGSSDGRVLGYLVFSSTSLKVEAYLHDLAGGKSAQKIVETNSLFRPFFIKHRLFALTDQNAPNLRIVAIDADHPECDRWVDIVPQSQYRIEDFAVVGDFVCVSYLENSSGRIETFGLTDRRRYAIPCPPHGTPRLIKRSVESDTLFYEFTAFNEPRTIFSCQPSGAGHSVWAKPQVPFDPTSIDIRQVCYKSKDGTQVPMFLIAQKGRLSGEPMPTLLTAYGGFGYKHTPRFQSSSAFLLEQGFLFAIANVRGGGELGEQWHLAGKRHNRQNAIDDFISAAEWLVENRYAAQRRVAISGGSNAGLLVGAALTQRPELFRVVICSGPLLDMLRYHRFDFADRWIDEYGCSENHEDFLHLLAYSPYQRVENGVPYPAVMLVSGDADTCCNPMHARKMAARLQAATSSVHPILLNYNPTWGHVPVQPLNRRIEALTDRLVFICRELGVRV